MHILVTNDDGVSAPGLLALAQAMRKMGKVSVLAPDHNWSGSGHVKTLDRPLRAKPYVMADGEMALASDGAPSDCVALGLMGVLEEPVDLVVSGINPSPNVGHDLTYSGTVTAAMEASIFGVRGIAVSVDGYKAPRGAMSYEAAAEVTLRIAKMVVEHDFPTEYLLNVNVPYLPLDELKGFRFTRQGMRIYQDELVKRLDPRGVPYYWIGGEAPTGVPEDGTDIGALAEGYVSITPVHLDLTAYHMLEKMRSWEFPNQA